jgi:hypothetical protein
MSVLVQFTVKVSDVDRFVATSEKFAPMMQEMGGRQGGVYEDENEPGLVSNLGVGQPRPDACGVREARRPVQRRGGDRRARLDDPHLAPEGERLIRSPSGFRYLALELSGHRR